MAGWSRFPALEAAAGQDGNIAEGDGQREAGRGDQVERLPIGIEFLLVVPQPFEAVDLVGVLIDEGAKLGGESREAMVFKSGQRRHAEVKGLHALFLAPEHEFDEQEVHDAFGRRIAITHQVDSHFAPVSCRH